MARTHDCIEFEIPREWEHWLIQSGLAGNVLSQDHFRSNDAEAIVDIREIASPIRGTGVVWFHENSMLPILRGIASNHSIPPVQVDCPPQGSLTYRVRDGFHRYYASVLLGFRRVPVQIVSYFECGRS